MKAQQHRADQAAPVLPNRQAPSFHNRFRRVANVVTSGRFVPTVLAALVLTVISWPVTDLVPKAGLDPSWQAGLAMAFLQRLR